MKKKTNVIDLGFERKLKKNTCGEIVGPWLGLWPHIKKVVGLSLGLEPFCVEFVHP